MNKRTIKSIEKTDLKKDDGPTRKQVRLLLGTETNGVPEEQLDGLMVRNRATSWQNYGQSEQGDVATRHKG